MTLTFFSADWLACRGDRSSAPTETQSLSAVLGASFTTRLILEHLNQARCTFEVLRLRNHEDDGETSHGYKRKQWPAG